MKKAYAVEILGNGFVAEAAERLGIVKTALYQWPDELTQKQADWVRGAAMRLGVWPGDTPEDIDRREVIDILRNIRRHHKASRSFMSAMSGHLDHLERIEAVANKLPKAA